MPNVKPTWWLNYIHFTDQQREGKRPLILHRWGGLGNHRYQVAFSGDTNSSWEQLGFQFWFTATAANVGFAYWSHDIGGHLPGVVDPELFTRWVQFGGFSPILRTHFTKNPDAERRPWAYPEPYSDILRSAYQLRYALEPYTYTEARKTFDTGIAFFHPLYYDWPDADAAYSSKGEYVFGDQMLVAPVATASDKITGLSAENVWLPSGRMDRVANRQILRGGGRRRQQLLPQLFDRPGSGLSPRGRHRPHATAYALHRRKARRPADRECMAARGPAPVPPIPCTRTRV